MPRTGRLSLPGGCYHLIGRGLEKRSIFEHTVDKRDVLTRFGKLLRRTNCQCLAWALMSNHYHFLVRSSARPLKDLMSPVLGGFAGAYNRRYGRCGYVFQCRFTSILCDEEAYLLELVRYIHLNPLRAGIVENLQDLGRYPWTGHAGLLGRHRKEWHFTDEVLTHFGTTRRKAIRKYLDFLQAGIDAPGEVDLSGGGLVRSYGGWEEIARFRREHKVRIGDERILGDSDFVARVLKEDALAIESKSRLAREGWDLDRLIRKTCDLLNVDEADLLRKCRANDLSKAKAMICYWGTEKLGLKARQIADRLKISQPAVSQWVSKGRAMADNERLPIIFDELSY